MPTKDLKTACVSLEVSFSFFFCKRIAMNVSMPFQHKISLIILGILKCKVMILVQCNLIFFVIIFLVAITNMYNYRTHLCDYRKLCMCGINNSNTEII